MMKHRLGGVTLLAICMYVLTRFFDFGVPASIIDYIGLVAGIFVFTAGVGYLIIRISGADSLGVGFWYSLMVGVLITSLIVLGLGMYVGYVSTLWVVSVRSIIFVSTGLLRFYAHLVR